MNQYRACWGSGPLRYEVESEKTAQKWADRILQTGRFEHGMLTDSRGRPVGQNLLMSGPRYPIDKAVRKWYREYVSYSGNYSPQSGHFTQLVWNSTVGVGIGIARDSTRAVIVANFRPPGNVQGLFTKNVFAQKKNDCDSIYADHSLPI